MESTKEFNFQKISLKDFVEMFGTDLFHELVSEFSCPYDQDIENFLKQKAVDYEMKNGLATRTYLIGFTNDENNKFYICGYFTLSNLPFSISDKLSKSKIKKLTHGRTEMTVIPAVLIGQISKNYHNSLNETIRGKDILGYAIETIKEVYDAVGLDLVYLECKDIPKIREFYDGCGFDLYCDKDENPILSGKNNDLLCYIAKYNKIKINH